MRRVFPRREVMLPWLLCRAALRPASRIVCDRSLLGVPDPSNPNCNGTGYIAVVYADNLFSAAAR